MYRIDSIIMQNESAKFKVRLHALSGNYLLCSSDQEDGSWYVWNLANGVFKFYDFDSHVRNPICYGFDGYLERFVTFSNYDSGTKRLNFNQERALHALASYRVNGDEFSRALNALGYHSNLKIVKNYLGGWIISLDGQEITIEKLIDCLTNRG